MLLYTFQDKICTKCLTDEKRDVFKKRSHVRYDGREIKWEVQNDLLHDAHQRAKICRYVIFYLTCAVLLFQNVSFLVNI